MIITDLDKSLLNNDRQKTEYTKEICKIFLILLTTNISRTIIYYKKIMEILDLYDKNGNKLYKTHIRGEPLKSNEYCIAVDVWIKNNKGQFLLTQRHPSKIYPRKWECTSGCILSGEDSFTGALREVKEEIGINLKKEEGKNIYRICRHDRQIIFDIFLFNKSVNINEVKLQEDEVIDIKWIEKEELLEMFKREEMVEPLDYVFELIEKGLL